MNSIRSTTKASMRSPKPVQWLWLLAIAFLGGYLTGRQDITQKSLPVYPIAEHAIKVQFSPKGNCIQLIQEAIHFAKKRILVHAYAFTCPIIAAELRKAHQKGIEVRILVDRSQITARGSKVDYVKENHIPIEIDKVKGIAHNKVMIIDDLHVLTGSFNWSNAAATSNAENLLLITDKEINQLYTENWYERAKTAEPINLYTHREQNTDFFQW